MIEMIESMVGGLNNILWGIPMIVLLMGTHIYMTYKSGFIQRKVFTSIKLMFKKDDGAGGISPFASLATALASTIGTGNIIGVATAVALGGPGSIFWMWITGFLGMATKYAESLLAVKYRVKDKGGVYSGGAMYILENGLHMKGLAIVFAWLCVICSFGIGCSVQSNAIASLLSLNFNIPTWISGLVIAFLTFIVIYGGVKTISKTCEYLVPIMSFLYVLGCAYILVTNYHYILPAIQLILASAFDLKAIVGGGVGFSIYTACRYGIARGLFSNESGMGSSPIVSAAAKSKNPVSQALIASTNPFFDTVIVCLMTGLVLISTMLSNGMPFNVISDGNELCLLAFSAIPYIGKPILIVGIFTFAYSTILGWCYYGERGLDYLFGKKPLPLYRIIWCVVVFFGAVNSVGLVFDLADTFNALMAIPNIFALLLLAKVVSKETAVYIHDLDKEDQDEVPLQKEPIYAKKKS